MYDSFFEDFELSFMLKLCKLVPYWLYLLHVILKLTNTIDDLNSNIKFDNTEAIEHYFGQETIGNKIIDNLFNTEDDEDDDEDDNVVQQLMEKYRLKEEEPTIDEILEKIHEKGLSSLSIQEQAILNSYN